MYAEAVENWLEHVNPQSYSAGTKTKSLYSFFGGKSCFDKYEGRGFYHLT